MKKQLILLSIFACFTANATTFPTAKTPFSQYGQIQNVQNYSSNPFWDPNGPYNQRMPVPVYIQGTDVDTSDCQRVVSALVESYCSARNNCRDESLSDAKPTLTVQLANIPGHNFVTPCSGYIDTEFESYKKQNANYAPDGKAVAFPTATVPNPNATQQDIKFESQPAKVAPWAQEMMERKQELQELQAQNSSGTTELAKADFPKTFSDVSFSDRMQILKEGYEPYAGKSAYKQMNLESEEEYLTRMKNLAMTDQNIAKKILSKQEYCEKYGNIDMEYCNPQQAAIAKNEMIEKISQALKEAKK